MKKTAKKQSKKSNLRATPKNQFEKWLHSAVSAILPIYGISGITVTFHEKKVPGNSEHHGGSVIFRIRHSDAYKTADILYFPITVDLFMKKDWVSLRQGITHELAHIVTGRLGDLAHERYVNERELCDALENCTETIAQLGRKLINSQGIKIV